MRKGDPAEAGSVVGEPHVGGQLVAAPEHDDDAVCREERRLLDIERRRPAERLVERLRPVVVGDSEGHEAEALLHTPEPSGTGPCGHKTFTGVPQDDPSGGTDTGPVSASAIATSSPSLVPPVSGVEPPIVDVVVPVYDEVEALRTSVERLHAYLSDGFPFSARITIADNGSTDGTWEVALALAEELAERPRRSARAEGQRPRDLHRLV